ncbi:MAG: mandelate racemase [Planctomycetota bacterium]|nr:mandelate racemase [Planctomycetota bacterium]MDA1212787.1 mandelate racemase [Planctomycetota bacterium]
MKISRVTTSDQRFTLPDAAGTDSIHTDPKYSYAVTLLELDDGEFGTGLAFTLGRGTEVVVRAIEAFIPYVVGRDLNEIMPRFAKFWRELADESQLRWIGPQKGAIHLALASISSALVDAWCRKHQQPLWKLLLDMPPEDLIEWVDLRYLENQLTRKQALELLHQGEAQRLTNWESHEIITKGYPAYNTSVGWLGYDIDHLVRNCREQIAAGFGALKIKVGSPRIEDDIRRLRAVREAVGPDIRMMTDANQIWSVPQAIAAGKQLCDLDCFWIEEPTHPDDILGHQQIAREIAPLKIATGECVSNAILFKNLIQAQAVHFLQADSLRLGGLPEFLAVVLMGKQAGLPVVPHAGDMSQIHQHLATWQSIALGVEPYHLEYIPHLREHFVEPVEVTGGRYQLPRTPGSSTRLQGVSPTEG